jgi:hypothetical protein
MCGCFVVCMLDTKVSLRGWGVSVKAKITSRCTVHNISVSVQ